MTHEKMMEKAWNFINELGITEEKEEFKKDPDNHYLVENIYEVRDAYYSDLENNIEIEEEDLLRFFDRHKIKWG